MHIGKEPKAFFGTLLTGAIYGFQTKRFHMVVPHHA